MLQLARDSSKLLRLDACPNASKSHWPWEEKVTSFWIFHQDPSDASLHPGKHTTSKKRYLALIES